jgi:hypothetical protein
VKQKQIQLGVRIPVGLFYRMERARKDVPRAVFVKRALEQAVGKPGRALEAAQDHQEEKAQRRDHDPGQPRERGKGASRPANGGRRRASPEQTTAVARPVFQCPKCGFRARSDKATCPLHGFHVQPLQEESRQ